jgi:hypothetical protein
MSVGTFKPIEVTRFRYEIRVRTNGRASPIVFDADSAAQARELGEKKARDADLPLFFLGAGQDFDATTPDGVYVCLTSMKSQAREL